MEQDTNANTDALDAGGDVDNEHDHARPDDAGGNADNIPEKFINRETGEVNYAAAYKDAVFRLEQSKAAAKAAKAERKEQRQAADDELYLDPDTDGDGGDKEGDGEAHSPRIDLQPFFDEFSQYGDLSDSSYAKLEAMGLPRDLVENYAANQGAAAERTKAEITGVVGGEEDYAAMMEWAATELDADAIEAYNRLAEGKDVGAFKLAVRGLHQDYLEANGRPASKRIIGDGGGGGSGDTYADWAQVTADMRDNRYKTDAAYRAQVEAKLARSPLQGVRMTGDQVYRS